MVHDVRFHFSIIHFLAMAETRHYDVRRSEAASIDKMMHVLDYGRALGELLELDDTIRASIKRMLFSFFVYKPSLIGLYDLQT